MAGTGRGGHNRSVLCTGGAHVSLKMNCIRVQPFLFHIFLAIVHGYCHRSFRTCIVLFGCRTHDLRSDVTDHPRWAPPTPTPLPSQLRRSAVVDDRPSAAEVRRQGSVQVHRSAAVATAAGTPGSSGECSD